MVGLGLLRAAMPLLAIAALPLLSAKAQAPAAENPFVVRAEISSRSPWERSQVLYTVRVFRTAGARRFGRIRRLNDPVLLQGEALIEQLGNDRQYNFRSEDADSLVLERRYALYPQSTGEMLLQPASLQWIGEDFGFRTRSFVPDAGPERFVVRAVPSPPAGRWLAASDVTVWEEFEREPGELVAGEPLIRLLGVRVEGQPARQIPELRPGDGPNFRHFVERARFEDTVTAGGLVGVRRQRAALLALRAGDVVLPAIRLNWWNTTTESWETSELPRRVLQAQAPIGQDVLQPDESPREPVGPADWLAPLLALGWFLTGIAWWITHRLGAGRRLRRRIKSALDRDSRRRDAVAGPLKALAAACRRNDARQVEEALLAWARAWWSGDAPRDLGELGRRFGEPAETECRRLSAAVYGPGSPDWNAEVLLRAARRPPSLATRTEPGESRLPPLWPGSAAESG
ncbi:MAG: protein BatD [Gammaproteobacteria bacterium]|nr:protein BatD [Gammaproteobacteria bacterium]MYF68115.1 protein BatD [Gammaproteobacteria bacterium]MYK37602.1 protein BatD [Gammaproteobacteria bacterium]